MVTIDSEKVKYNKKIIDDIQIQVVYIPMVGKMGTVYTETVRVGDYVCIGSVIGKNPMVDVPLLSSVSGTVVGFQDKYISTNKLVRCIVIENDFKEKAIDKTGKKSNIAKYSKDEFIYMLKEKGIVGMSGNGFPTYVKYENQDNLKYLIVNGAECEAYIASDSARMYSSPEEILEGIDAIVDIMGLDKAYIAINEKNEVIINKFLKHINSYPNIKIYPLINAYPNGYERYLVSEILGKKYQNYPTEVGVVVENVGTVYAIYEMLKYHKPIASRIVTIAGSLVKNPANYLLKIGTSLSELLLKVDLLKEGKNPVIIAGGALMGTPIESEELVVTADLSGIIIMEDNEDVPEACIKCGKCSEVCPRNLIPSLIMSNPNRAKELRVDKCIGCGLCSYVCPSKIEVRDIISKIKEDNRGI